MDGATPEQALNDVVQDFAPRLAPPEARRFGPTFLHVVSRVHDIVTVLHPLAKDLKVAIDLPTDARHQEWVLLADLMGVSSRIEDLCSRLEVARPNIFAGPFHRDDVSERQQEASLCLDERGESLRARLCLTELAGQALRHEELGVWQTNPLGRDENRELDLQPEFNLKGNFRSDTDGLLEFLTVKPAGHALPGLCPVGHLLATLGQKPERPAHIPFRVSAPGVQTLTALVFDPDDPAIGDDALFDVRPGLTAEFHHLASDLEGPMHALDLTLILAPSAEGAEAAIPHASPMRKEPHHVQYTG